MSARKSADALGKMPTRSEVLAAIEHDLRGGPSNLDANETLFVRRGVIGARALGLLRALREQGYVPKCHAAVARELIDEWDKAGQ